MESPVKNLTHHPKNSEIYNLSNIQDLVDSIGSVGLLTPLVIDKSNQVISGNRRLAAIKQLGWKSVEVEVADLGDEDVVTILIHHNKHRTKQMREILNEYRALEKIHGKGQGRRTDLDTSGTFDPKSPKGVTTRDIVSKMIGLSSSQMKRLLFIDNNDPSFIDHIDDGTLTTNQAYWVLRKRISDTSNLGNQSDAPAPVNTNDYTFHHKSSNDMNEVDDESVQLCFTSPPYWKQRKYSDGGEVTLGDEPTPDEYVSNMISHLTDVYRVLSKEGSFFLNLGDKFQNGNLLNLPHKIVIGLQDKGWVQRNSVIWRKSQSKPSSSKSNLQQTYEFIFHLTKSKSYLYQPTRIPVVGDKGKSPEMGDMVRHKNLHNKKQPDFSVQRKVGHNNLKDGKQDYSYYPYIGDGKKNMGDYWDDVIITSAANHNGRLGNIKHPAPFPTQIVTPPLLQTTREGDLVLDPFHGSGTTGKVANAYGRKYVGYDVVSY
jgi:site-specific DNA-methyltransferase (adenine-specific)